MKKNKTAIIGCGNIANQKHMSALARLPEAEMTAFCDLIPERAQEAARVYGSENAQVYTDYRELLERSDVDDVRVCVDNANHCRITVDALRAGKHVLCEKPLAISYDEAKLMVKTARECGKVLSVGYQHRFSPEAVFLKKEMEKGNLGEIYQAKARVIRRRGAPNWGIFTQKELVGGGPMIDVGTHAIDLTLWLMNNYEPAYVLGVTYQKLKDQKELANPFGPLDPEKFTTEDSASALLVMKNGASVMIEASWLLNSLETGGVRFQLCGTEWGADNLSGKLRLNGVRSGSLYTLEPDLSTSGISYAAETKGYDPAIAEQATFLRAVRGEGELCVRAEQAAVVVRVIEGIYRSAETGKPIYFNEEE